MKIEKIIAGIDMIEKRMMKKRIRSRISEVSLLFLLLVIKGLKLGGNFDFDLDLGCELVCDLKKGIIF